MKSYMIFAQILSSICAIHLGHSAVRENYEKQSIGRSN